MEQKPFLREYDTVYGILRTFADEFLHYLGNTTDGLEERAAWIRDLCEKSADIFLGKNKAYRPDSLWNEPGYVDAYLATIMPFPTENAHERMRTFFVVFASKIKEMVEVSNIPGMLDEQWQESGALMYREFAMMLLGIPTEFAEDEEPTPTTVQESVGLSGRQRAMLERWKDYP
jgi:hypothetical protein